MYAPVKESHTMFEAFLEKEKKVVQNGKVDKPSSKDQTKTGNDTKKSGQPKKKKGDQEKKHQHNFEEAVAMITKSEIMSTLTVTQTRFPDNAEVWLKDLASFLNLKLEDVPEPDPLFKNKPKDFPKSELKKDCCDVIRKVLKESSSVTLEHLLYHSIQTMLTESAKGHSTYGYRIFVQLMAEVKPTIILTKLSQYSELLKTHQNQSQKCLSILWCLGQCGIRDLRCGIRIWIDLMQQLLGVRSIASHCVQYLENLFSNEKDLKSVYGEITVREYFHLVDLIFGEKFLQQDMKKRLQAVYPKLKTIAYCGTYPPSERSFFPSYLSRTTQNCNATMKAELLSCLSTCLIKDKQCFSVWCQMYTKHLPQSSVLMKYLLDNWGTLNGKIDKKLLQNTLRSFSITNDELAAQGRNSMDGFDSCVSACKELLQKLSESKFPWFGFIFTLIALVTAAIVAYDIYTSPYVKRSKTVRFLEDYGILAFSQQVWTRITTYTGLAYRWTMTNVPLYFDKVEKSVGPYIWTAWDTVYTYVMYVVDVSSPLRQWLMLKFVQGIDKIYSLSPDFWSEVGKYLWLSWDFFRDYTFWIYDQMVILFLSLYKWIEEKFILNDFSAENAKQMWNTAISSISSHMTHLIEWCAHLFAATNTK